MPAHTRLTLTAVALIALGFAAARVLAIGAPVQTPLTYAGTVTDAAGKPYANTVEVTVAFYDAATAGTQKCKAPPVQAEAGTGRFSVVLPSECGDAVHDKTELWSEALVGPQKTALPRVHVGAVPYALEAEQAKVATVAGGTLKAQLDAQAADITGLKAAGGASSGGPWLVDAAGLKLGRLLGLTEDTYGGYGALNATAASRYQVLTSTGHVVDLNADGSLGKVPISTVAFTGTGCSGNVLVYLPTGSVMANRRALAFYNKKLYAINGPIAAASGSSKNIFQSVWSNMDGKCTDQLTSWDSVVLQETTQLAIGLPATITTPLTIAP